MLANDGDPDGDALVAAVFEGPTHGTLVLQPNGAFEYTPDAGYGGPDGFTYRVSDGYGGMATGTVAITVSPVNDAPVAVDDSYTTDEDTPLTIAAPGVLANDSDPDGDVLVVALLTGPTHGTLVLQPNGAFDYTPAAGYGGPDGFTYP